MNLAPIVLFVYNRPWHTRQTIEALQKNELASESELFIFADAPKNKGAEEKVKEVREYIKTINGFKKITIIEREKNFGLANNIIDGVTKVINEYGKIIVLEDDLITSPYFLKFMNDALEFYEDEKKVMHISGYVYPIDNKGLEDTFFIKPTTCWGWATWSRAWKYFKKDAEYYIKVFDKKMIKDFNINNSYDYFSQIVANQKGELNTWAIFWYASVYLNNGLSLHPKESFVKNIGHDGKGVHCEKTSIFDVTLNENYPIKFAKEIKENKEARKRLEEYFNKIAPSFLKKIIIKILKKVGMYKIFRAFYIKKELN